MTAAPGRPRDPDIDRSVLAAAQRHLAAHGYEAMSVVAVAEEAGTTRQAVYRRWPSKADLATAAIAALAEAEPAASSRDPYTDLVRELERFHRGVSRPNGISLVGSMLQGGVDPELRRLYRERVVAPRRRRLRAVLESARDRGLLAADADVALGVAACTGTRYALELAGTRAGRDWPERTARLVWLALGGTPPGTAGTPGMLAGAAAGPRTPARAEVRAAAARRARSGIRRAAPRRAG